MTEIIDGYERVEVPLSAGDTSYCAAYYGPGGTFKIYTDRICVDRMGPGWQRRMEALVLKRMLDGHAHGPVEIDMRGGA